MKSMKSFGCRRGQRIGANSLAGTSSPTTPTAKPQASNRNPLLDQLGEEMLASAKRLATDPEHRRRIQKKLV